MRNRRRNCVVIILMFLFVFSIYLLNYQKMQLRKYNEEQL